jgi:GMP synthase-like glutamine amidotransferase
MNLLLIKHEDREGAGRIKDFLDFKELYSDELKGNEEFESLIIMGGSMSVYEMNNYPFLKIEEELIRKAIKENKRVLGICLGSQLISHTLGGLVNKGSFGSEIGFKKIKTLGEIKEILGGEIEVFQWHEDAFTIPEGAELLGYSEKYYQIIKYKRALGIQFHPEVTYEMVNEWTSEVNNREEILTRARELDNYLRELTRKILSYWLTI